MARRCLEARTFAAPCFDSVRDVAGRLRSLAAIAGAAEPGASWPAVAEIDAALAPLAGVRFVAGDKIRRRRRPDRQIEAAALYEIRIASRREVPTRSDSAHDLLNALAWAAFPSSKWALTRRLADAQRVRLADRPWRLPGARTRAHDRLALLDEGGILVASGGGTSGDTLLGCLASGGGCALVFGHALLEHALAGQMDVWGAALSLPVDPRGSIPEVRIRLDTALAEALERGSILERPEPWPRLFLREIGIGSRP